MSVLDRDTLEDSPLADLHSLASELGIDGFRRLRKAELIDALLARQGGDEGTAEAPEAPAEDEAEERPRRTRRRGGRRVTAPMKSLRESASNSGRPSAATSSRRCRSAMVCAGVLAKSGPGSRTICSSPTPRERASSIRSRRKATTSATTSS